MNTMKNINNTFKYFTLLLVFAYVTQVYGQKFNHPVYVLPATDVYSQGDDAMGVRLFKTTSIRKQVNLAGFWQFIPDPDDVGESSQYFKVFPKADADLYVPGTWNTNPKYWQYEGTGWYKRDFVVPSKGNWNIHFQGAFYHARVWLDGKFLGEHEGGYSPFSFLVKNLQPGIYPLVVKVNNRTSRVTLPKIDSDWFPYGGITRPVYAERVNDAHIERVHITTEKLEESHAVININLAINNVSAKAQKKDLTIYADGKILLKNKLNLNTGVNETEVQATINNPKTWSTEDPELYLAQVVLGKEEDDRYERFGIRLITKNGTDIFLNGKKLTIYGANHHDDHPDWGSALPPNIIRKDIEIIKRLGANAVRGHYPPAHMFLDFCDQHGLLFLNEIPCWQYDEEQLSNPELKTLIKQQFREMVMRDMGHPCIFSWSLGNEWPDMDKSYHHIKELIDYARSLDEKHFITFITGGAEDVGRACELIDILSINWTKYNWYDTIPVIDKNSSEKWINYLHEAHDKYPDVPIVITEFGHGESQIGWHNFGNVKWSEEYQAINVRESAKLINETNWISGGCVWQFCNTRTSPERMLEGRLRGWNTKGIVDEYRMSKSSFYLLQEIYYQYNKNLEK